MEVDVLNQSQYLMFLNQSCIETVTWTIKQLNQGGLQVMQTFYFESARYTASSYNCLNHDKERSDCQMVVLLVYGKGSPPISLVAHGFDGKTWLGLVETFQVGNPVLKAQVRKILTLSSNRPDDCNENNV